MHPSAASDANSTAAGRSAPRRGRSHRRARPRSRPDGDAGKLLRPETFGREYLELSRSAVYRLIAAGLPTVRVGAVKRIDPVAALAWLKAQEAPSIAEVVEAAT